MENKKLTHLAGMLRKYRELNELTQEFVATQLNISRSTYSYYEIGKTEPNIKSLCILAKMFGVKVEDFLHDERKTVLRDSRSASPRKEQESATMRSLSSDERQLVAFYRLANARDKRKMMNDLKKAKEK